MPLHTDLSGSTELHQQAREAFQRLLLAAQHQEEAPQDKLLAELASLSRLVERTPDRTVGAKSGKSLRDQVSQARALSTKPSELEQAIQVLREDLDAGDVVLQTWVGTFGNGDDHADWDTEDLQGLSIDESTRLKCQALRARLLLAIRRATPEGAEALQEELALADGKGDAGDWLGAGLLLEAALEGVSGGLSGDISFDEALKTYRETTKVRQDALIAELKTYQRLLDRSSDAAWREKLLSSRELFIDNQPLNYLVGSALSHTDNIRGMEEIAALVKREFDPGDVGKQAWLDDFGNDPNFDIHDHSGKPLDEVLLLKTNALKARLQGEIDIAPRSVAADLTGRKQKGDALLEAVDVLGAGKVYEAALRHAAAEKEAFLGKCQRELVAITARVRDIKEDWHGCGDDLGVAQIELGSIVSDLQGAVEEALRKQTAMVEAANSWFTWRSTTRKHARDLRDAQGSVAAFKKAAESIYINSCSWTARYDVVIADNTSLHKRIEAFKVEITGTSWLESDGGGMLRAEFGQLRDTYLSELHAKIAPLEDELGGFETFLSGFIVSVIAVEGSAKRSLSEVFGADVQLDGGGISMDLHADKLDEIFGKGMAKDFDKRAELETLSNLLMPQMATVVQQLTHKDAVDVPSLPDDEIAAAQAAAEQAVLDILKVNAQNRSDRTATNALQGIQASLALLSAASAGVKLAVSFGADPTGYIQAIKAVKKLVDVVREARSSLDKRRTTLEEALAEISARPGFKTQAEMANAVRTAVSSGDALDILKAAKSVFTGATEKLSAARTARRLHGSKTAALFGEWHQARLGIEELLKLIDGLADNVEELHTQMGSRDEIEVDGKVITRERVDEMRARIPKHQEKLNIALKSIVEVGERYQEHLMVQVKSGKDIEAATTLSKKALLVVGGTLTVVQEGVTAGTDLATIISDHGAAFDALQSDNFWELCGDNAFALGMDALEAARDAATEALSELLSLGF